MIDNDGFEPPANQPQFEVDEESELAVLFYDAPEWQPEYFAAEVVTLFRRHVALRSALRFALEQARGYELELRALDEPRDVYRTQGKVIGLTTFVNALMAHLEEAEQPKEKQDA